MKPESRSKSVVKRTKVVAVSSEWRTKKIPVGKRAYKLPEFLSHTKPRPPWKPLELPKKVPWEPKALLIPPPSSSHTLNDLPLDVLANHIFPFVGGHQYRYIGGVSRNFCLAYRQTYPEKTTKYRMHSIKHAQFCWSDVPEKDRPLLEQIAKRQIWERLSHKRNWHFCSHGDDLENEDKALLQWAQSTFGCTWVFWKTPNTISRSPCEFAASMGDVQTLKWARINGCDWNENTCQVAVANRNYGVLKWAREHGCPWDKGTCEAAAAKGHFDYLEWAREQGCPWDEMTCQAAAAAGRLDILTWLRGYHYKYGNGFARACAAGDIRLLGVVSMQFRDDVCPWDAKTCEAAAAGGHLFLLKWARAHKCDWNATACCEAAASGGHLEVLKWAHSEGCRLPAKIYEIAAAHGHLEILKWARNYTALKSAKICEAAAAGNHAAVLAWARENGCQ